ncbi:MAG TPA: RNA 2',3'-cyclic phosphodiesterase [Anaerolineales bacterium]|nr:RNA 2',3'-cyclic phosphodiesterase [Anaerolineales bacterium]
MDRLRTFIAVDIPSPIQKSIQLQINNLRKIIGDSSVRWVSVHNIHLTLKFLGDVSLDDVDTLSRILSTETDNHSAFDIQINGLGSFPGSKRVRVLLNRIKASAELEALQRGIESACSKTGFKSEARPFKPHLTIGRVWHGVSSSEQIKICKTLDGVKIDSLGTARVDSVYLYKSELKPTGSVYTKLFSAPLRERGEIWTH